MFAKSLTNPKQKEMFTVTPNLMDNPKLLVLFEFAGAGHWLYVIWLLWNPSDFIYQFIVFPDICDYGNLHLDSF